MLKTDDGKVYFFGSNFSRHKTVILRLYGALGNIKTADSDIG